MPSLTHTLFLVHALCVGHALSSAYYNNEFFPRITKAEADMYWTDDVDAHSIIKQPFYCETVLR